MAWNLTHDDIERIAIGAGILGTGGGGNPYRGMTRAQLQLDQGHQLQIVGLDELPDDALVVPIGGMGAPTIGLEKIGRGDEGKVAIEELQSQLGVKVAATVPVEVGGGNSFTPMIAATQLGLPTVDADGMGRAFPELDMVSYYFDGVAPSPIVMVDCQHRKVIIRDVAESLNRQPPTGGPLAGAIVINAESAPLIGEFDSLLLAEALKSISAGSLKMRVNKASEGPLEIRLKSEARVAGRDGVIDWKVFTISDHDPFHSFTGSNEIRMALAARIIEAHGGSAERRNGNLRVRLPLS